ncbi:MAG: tetratricopeptide repeat protein [bacterium]
MNRKFTKLLLILTLCLFVPVSYSQTAANKWSVGLNVGGQKLYGDGSTTNVGLGPGFEGLVSYKVLRFIDLSFALGYSMLKYDRPGKINSFTDIINSDVKGIFEIYSKGIFRPYITLGLGLLNVRVGGISGRFWEESVFGGGGVKFLINSRFTAMLGADYRMTNGDALDLTNGGANDGYLNVRSGVNYNLSRAAADDEQPDVIASERAPLFEVEDEPVTNELQNDYPVNGELETQNMEEYVKLKSRIDALTESVDKKENEIDRLRNDLTTRKRQLTSMETKAARQPAIPLSKRSSMSGFSEIYEQALTNYYNKSYQDANSLFGMLLQKFPQHSLASNCQYWIAQSLLAMNRYQEAIAAFNKVLSYRRSLKKDDALFLLGKAYLKIGSGEKAKQTFSRLIQDYPRSEFIKDAMDYVAKL